MECSGLTVGLQSRDQIITFQWNGAKSVSNPSVPTFRARRVAHRRYISREVMTAALVALLVALETQQSQETAQTSQYLIYRVTIFL